MPPGPDLAEGAPKRRLPHPRVLLRRNRASPIKWLTARPAGAAMSARPVSDSKIRPLRRRHSQRASSRSAYRACMTMHDQPVPKTHGFAADRAIPWSLRTGCPVRPPPMHRYTTPRPSGKLHPQAVGGADGRYGGSPEGQRVTRAVPPFCTPDWVWPHPCAGAQDWIICVRTMASGCRSRMVSLSGPRSRDRDRRRRD